jgi:hypothetical protein
VVPERLVDAVRMRIEPRLQRLERADFNDLPVAYRNGSSYWQ